MTAKYSAGTRVLVDGVTAVGDLRRVVTKPVIRVIGSGLPIKTLQKSVSELNSGLVDNKFVETEGVLRACDKTWTRICFRIIEGNATAWVVAPHPDTPATQLLIGATVRVKGVNSSHLDAAEKRFATQIFMDGLENIKVLEPAPADPFSSPPVLIDSLRVSYADLQFVHSVHVHGTVTWESGGRFFVQDGSGSISGDTGNSADHYAGRNVDVVGFPSHGDLSALMLSDSMVRVSPTQSNRVMAPLDVTAAEVVGRSLNGWRVRLKARLISQKTLPLEYEYQFEDGSQRFTAILSNNSESRGLVGLPSDVLLQLTGVAIIRSRTPERPESFQLLIESPADMVVMSQTGWFTFKHVLGILGVMGACVIATLVWITMLRRTVRKQTAINRIRLENELQLETRYRRLFERNLAAVFRWRPGGVIVDFNMAFVKMLGLHTHEELAGRSFWDFHADPEQREHLRHITQEDALRNYEIILRRDDGMLVYLLVNITPVQTPEGLMYETTAIDVTQQRHHQAELQKAKDTAVHDSLNDPLTGLPNRRLVSIRLASLFDEAKVGDSMIGLLYLDLDGFKAINDTHGHAVGDAVLLHVANQLRSRVRHEDVIARIGGNEFMVILGNLHELEEAVNVAKILQETIIIPFMVGELEVTIRGSIGISVYPESALDAEELMKQADSAMYAAKREGKNRLVCFTPEIGSFFHERMTLENQLRGVVQRNELSLHFQPEFVLASNRLIRFEALARWNHPDLGSISPAKFIPIAEESGLIVSLGAFIMEQACLEAVKWRETYPCPIQVAVNVSNIQLQRRGFVEEVSAILEVTGLPPELLQIELTESVMMKNSDYSSEIMSRLHSMGIGLAVDDFGTGYSCLSYLPLLPFDALKIDSSFVRGLGTLPKSESMIHTLIMLAHNIGMLVIVEGVETREQLDLLRSMGADEAQGYYLGRPSAHPVEAIRKSLAEINGDVLTVSSY
jgi:diguanylate cyclase (GGDEF)-like protein/PAS domain S-box-containing protein